MDLEAIPAAWKYPEDTTARIEYFGHTHAFRFRGHSLAGCAHPYPFRARRLEPSRFMTRGEKTDGLGGELWRWRQQFAQRIAACIDPARFGVRNIYMFGSTELRNASVGSDIDLIIVAEGNEQQHRELEIWLEGWGFCLAEISCQLYGLPSNGLLDVKFLNPEQARSEIPSFTAAGKTLQALPVGAAPLSKTQS